MSEVLPVGRRPAEGLSAGTPALSESLWLSESCQEAAPHPWNQLPTELKLCQSTALFKRKLKTFLFTASYGVSENI